MVPGVNGLPHQPQGRNSHLLSISRPWSNHESVLSSPFHFHFSFLVLLSFIQIGSPFSQGPALLNKGDSDFPF
jgi:hypothetical protein